MSCKELRSKDGELVMFTCSRGTEGLDYCDTCGRPATKMCGFPLVGAKKGRACDRKLCDGCATEIRTDRLPALFREAMQDVDTLTVCQVHHRFVTSKEAGGSS